MNALRDSTTSRWVVWFGRGRDALLAFLLGRLESNVFRFALLTALLISAINQFVGWKYVGVVMREVVAVVQTQVLPWSGSDREYLPLVPPRTRVVALLIGDELFADKEGFGHRVPLPPDKVQQLLQSVAQAAPERARIVVDFDLAPRVGENMALRRALDGWLNENAHRLWLVEPAWTARHAETLRQQLDWAWRMCRVGPYGAAAGAVAVGSGAVFVQSALVSSFGLVVDSLPRSGERGPQWDMGRALADPLDAEGRRRNPICNRLRGDAPAPAPVPVALNPLMLQLMLSKELQQFGALRVSPQPVAAKGHGANVLLRSEYLRPSPACQPGSFDEIATLPCLRDADVVVVGGAWSHGFTDRHDTFVGELDGAVVQAAWIRSWLEPVGHLNKAFELLLDAVIIERLLHPILKFSFVGMRRRSSEYVARVNSRRVEAGIGLHVAVMLGSVALAGVAFAGTAFALIVVDGVLRWAFNLSLSLDTTLLALLLWSALGLSSAGSVPGLDGSTAAHEERFPKESAAWLTALCALSITAVFAAWQLSHSHPSAVPALVSAVLVGVPVGFVALTTARRFGDADREKQNTGRQLFKRWLACRLRFRALWASVWLSLQLAARPVSSQERRWSLRLIDAFGALVWSGLWVYGLWVFASSAVWGTVRAIFGG